MLDNLMRMFESPQVQGALEKRVIDMLAPPDSAQRRKQSIGDALANAGAAMAGTPGNFLTGLTSGIGAGAQTYRQGMRPSGQEDKNLTKVLDLLASTGKATDLNDYRMQNLERMKQADASRSDASLQRLAIMKLLGMDRNDIGRQNADTQARRADIYGNAVENQNENRTAGTGIRQQQVDNQGRNIDSQIDTRARQLQQGERRIDQGDVRLQQGQQRIDDSRDYRTRSLEISQQNADTARKNAERVRASGTKNPAQLEINAANHLLNAKKEIFKDIGEFATEEDRQRAQQEYDNYEREFRSGLNGGTTGGQSSSAPVKIQSKAEFDSLPSGTRFVAPDGSIRVKP